MNGLTKLFRSSTWWAQVLIPTLYVTAQQSGFDMDWKIAAAGMLGYAVKESAARFGLPIQPAPAAAQTPTVLQ